MCFGVEPSHDVTPRAVRAAHAPGGQPGPVLVCDPPPRVLDGGGGIAAGPGLGAAPGPMHACRAAGCSDSLGCPPAPPGDRWRAQRTTNHPKGFERDGVTFFFATPRIVRGTAAIGDRPFASETRTPAPHSPGKSLLPFPAEPVPWRPGMPLCRARSAWTTAPPPTPTESRRTAACGSVLTSCAGDSL